MQDENVQQVDTADCRFVTCLQWPIRRGLGDELEQPGWCILHFDQKGAAFRIAVNLMKSLSGDRLLLITTIPDLSAVQGKLS